MQNKLLPFFTLFICSAVTFLNAAHSDQIHLGFRLTAGHSYEVVKSTNAEFVSTLDNTETKQNFIGNETFRINILEVDSVGNTKAKVIYDQLSLTFNPASEDTKTDTLVCEQAENIIKGQSFEIVFNAAGEIKEISGNEEIRNQLLSQLENADESLIDLISNLLNTDFLKEDFQDLLGYFPKQPLAQTESWKNTFHIHDPNHLIEKTFTWAGPENPAAIYITSKSIYNEHHNYKLEGTGEGTLLIDPETGWCLERKHTETIQGTLHMEAVEDIPMTGRVVYTVISRKLW